MFAAVFILALCAGLNRARGDDRWMPSWLPGRALWYVALVIGLIALLSQPPLAAAAIALAYLVWGVPAWGTIYDLGRLPGASGDHLRFFARMLLAVPLLLVFGWCGALLGVLFAGLSLAAYELAWRWRPDNPIWLAECATGALWGGLILAL
ncbi:hypothetical protein [Bosea minatitlanensis]|uniref:Phosphatidate cytidylyltransferase n=1 Tax=Bosea minatitlanensis TaxID=128782 RepID=A0ABW0EZ07_9HYPH|nr:hypothetical protein [Bosea minatitlanensis]MCT4491685.1 hypothetical protein [Bosea minatitlanensis]